MILVAAKRSPIKTLRCFLRANFQLLGWGLPKHDVTHGPQFLPFQPEVVTMVKDGMGSKRTLHGGYNGGDKQ